MKEIDRISIEERGFGGLILMENAGIRILETAQSSTDFAGRSVVCAAGSGNNGGDALVIARQIFSGLSNPVSIIIISEEGTPAYNFNLNLCRNLGIRIINADDRTAESELNTAGIIFDGLSGTGIKGGLREPAAGLAGLINSSNAFIISIDVPSGLGDAFENGFLSVKADLTLTVGLPKRCLYLPAARSRCGDIKNVGIGFPDDVKNNCELEPDGRCWRLICSDEIDRLMPVLQPGDYKNSRGHLAVFAGSPGTTGAASLCAEAAIRTGAGLVSLIADEDIYPILAAKHNAVMVKPRAADEKLPDLKFYNAIAAGPGWGRKNRGPLLMHLLKNGRGVLDADGINELAATDGGGKRLDLGGRWVLTPHPGEFRRLFPDTDCMKNPYEAAVNASETLNCVILLKGPVSYVAAPDGRCAVLDGVYPKLGTAGSGDLLCGLIGGYIACGMDIFDAAVLGASVHLRAGRRCGSCREWFSSEDLLEFL